MLIPAVRAKLISEPSSTLPQRGRCLNISQAAAPIRDEEAAAYFFYRGFADICVHQDSDGAIANWTFAEAYFARANLYHAKGDNDQALEDASKAVQINPLLMLLTVISGLVGGGLSDLLFSDTADEGGPGYDGWKRLAENKEA